MEKDCNIPCIIIIITLFNNAIFSSDARKCPGHSKLSSPEGLSLFLGLFPNSERLQLLCGFLEVPVVGVDHAPAVNQDRWKKDGLVLMEKWCLSMKLRH